MATILITGGSGLIGTHLTAALKKDGHAVRWMSRKAGTRDGVRAHAWDLERMTLDEAAVEGLDHIIHLAGASIAEKRWSEKRIEEMILSRTRGPELLFGACGRRGQWPKSFITSAGTGYYGAVTSEHIFMEEDAPGTDTIARISVAWERAADTWNDRTRVVKLRTPVVLTNSGGALQPLARMARWGVAAAMGTGRQWMPWVQIDDLVDVYRSAMDHERMNGAYNAVAGNVTNEDLMRSLAREIRRPYLMPKVPARVLKIVLGEVANALLEGSRVSNKKLLATGFQFKHLALEATLRELLGND